MHHLVYTSAASIALTEADLRRLLERWRATNVRLGVTGVLLYSDGQILQVLEGDPVPVHALFATIAADMRHQGVTKLADGPVQGRAFASWSMGFRTVDSRDFTHLVQRMSPVPTHATALAPLLTAFMESGPWE